MSDKPANVDAYIQTFPAIVRFRAVEIQEGAK